MKVLDLVEKAYNMAVWNNEGKQYLPLFGYNDEVVAYAPAKEAINSLFDSRTLKGERT